METETTYTKNLELNWEEILDEVARFIYRITRDKELTKDLVHDVFLKVYERLSQLKESEKLVGWMYTIARNAITDHFRRTAKKISRAELDWDSDPPGLNECVTSCVTEMMTTLPPSFRQAIELTEFKRLSQVELANVLGISYSGAKSRVQRARQLLRLKLENTCHLDFDAYGNVLNCENPATCEC